MDNLTNNQDDGLAPETGLVTDGAAVDLGTINFTDPDGLDHDLPIVGYHIVAEDVGYLLVIGNEASNKYISSSQFTILKFEKENIVAIQDAEEYNGVSELFEAELAKK